MVDSVVSVVVVVGSCSSCGVVSTGWGFPHISPVPVLLMVGVGGGTVLWGH